MATTKNITMKQFNGTDYDTLYPKTIAEQVEGIYSKEEILANATKTLYGLDASAIPDDAFSTIKNLLSTLEDKSYKEAEGSYIGTGTTTTITITLGVKPKLIFLYGSYTNGEFGSIKGYIITDIVAIQFHSSSNAKMMTPSSTSSAIITDTGFAVYPGNTADRGLNVNGKTYQYWYIY